MESLKDFIFKLVTVTFCLLLLADPLEDIFLQNKWEGCPKEMYPLMGALLAALATDRLRSKLQNGKKDE